MEAGMEQKKKEDFWRVFIYKFFILYNFFFNTQNRFRELLNSRVFCRNISFFFFQVLHFTLLWEESISLFYTYLILLLLNKLLFLQLRVSIKGISSKISKIPTEDVVWHSIDDALLMKIYSVLWGLTVICGGLILISDNAHSATLVVFEGDNSYHLFSREFLTSFSKMKSTCRT